VLGIHLISKVPEVVQAVFAVQVAAFLVRMMPGPKPSPNPARFAGIPASPLAFLEALPGIGADVGGARTGLWVEALGDTADDLPAQTSCSSTSIHAPWITSRN
jgi:hypothetical protein